MIYRHAIDIRHFKALIFPRYCFSAVEEFCEVGYTPHTLGIAALQQAPKRFTSGAGINLHSCRHCLHRILKLGARSTHPFRETAADADATQCLLPYEACTFSFNVRCPSVQHELMFFRWHLDPLRNKSIDVHQTHAACCRNPYSCTSIDTEPV